VSDEQHRADLLASLESEILSADTGAADRLREQLTSIYGPGIMHEALDSAEAQQYIAARRYYEAEIERHVQRTERQRQEIAERINSVLPDGMEFEWVTGDER
jgi:hypothetical protein